MQSERRFLKTLLLATFIVGGLWLLMNKEKIKQPTDVVGLVKEQIDSTGIGTIVNNAGNGSAPAIQDWPVQQNAGAPFGPAGYQAQPVQQRPRLVGNVIRNCDF